jgi:hypothetical protein
MLNELAKEWVAALRSGEFVQGIGCLNMDNKLCCLGVACEVYRKHKPDFEYTGQSGYLPGEVRDALGLASDNGSSYDEDTLVSLNDSKNLTFHEIADVIEREPSGLFN